VPGLIFNAKTLKLCSKIKFATQAQQTAPSFAARLELFDATFHGAGLCVLGAAAHRIMEYWPPAFV
jgi:hypothetical protein